jgi:hypothetical protein
MTLRTASKRLWRLDTPLAVYQLYHQSLAGRYYALGVPFFPVVFRPFPSELLEMHIEWVVYHTHTSIMCGYVVCVPDCRGSICCASHPFDLYFK